MTPRGPLRHTADPPADETFVPALAALAAKAAHLRAGAPEPVVLADRPDGTVVRVGRAVAKAHARGTDTRALAARLAIAAHPDLRGILLPPYATTPGSVGERPVSVWPFGQAVDPDEPGAAPWEAAGTLLARLHRVPPAALSDPPPMRGPAKVAAAMVRLRAVPASPAVSAVRAAWRRLPAWARGEGPGGRARAALCHGDWHLGQLVRHPVPDGDWLLIDVDDLGTGQPAWDLARPAMWFAAGLLAPEVWARFLGAYRAAGGPAAGEDGDPWPHLDVPARALAVQTAAIAVAKASRAGRVLDEAESELVATCARIAQLE